MISYSNKKLSVIDVRSLGIIKMNVEPSCLKTKKRPRNQVLLHKKKKRKTLLMAVHENVDKTKTEVWYVDTGCSNHMSVVVNPYFLI